MNREAIPGAPCHPARVVSVGGTLVHLGERDDAIGTCACGILFWEHSQSQLDACAIRWRLARRQLGLFDDVDLLPSVQP